MALRLLGVVLAAFAVFAAGAACSDNDSDEGATVQDRQRFEARVQDRLDDIDAKISDLERRAQAQGGNAREDLEEQLDDLKDERDELDDKLTRLRNATDAEWQRLADDIEDALGDLERKIEDL
ncbi:MAG TPA: hypothetical protein VNN10_15275 [Dehalococcoidia bacterium]|nr:hypothetical protein [Dehalococcoidia bacterium]